MIPEKKWVLGVRGTAQLLNPAAESIQVFAFQGTEELPKVRQGRGRWFPV